MGSLRNIPERKKSQDASWISRFISIVEMVDIRRIEIDIALGITGHGSYVMKSFYQLLGHVILLSFYPNGQLKIIIQSLILTKITK